MAKFHLTVSLFFACNYPPQLNILPTKAAYLANKKIYS